MNAFLASLIVITALFIVAACLWWVKGVLDERKEVARQYREYEKVIEREAAERRERAKTARGKNELLR